MSAHATYHYPLQTLQDLREAELVPARAALADVDQRIRSIDHDTACCQDGIQAAEQSLRAGQREGVLQIEQQRVVRLFLAGLRREMSALVATAASLQVERAQYVAHLQQARSALRMLELHRARLAGAHAISAARKAQGALDDGWLSRLRQRGGAA
jgi:hypothetical protein